MFDSQHEKIAKTYTKGVLKQLLSSFFALLVWVFIITVIANAFGWGVDPTDKSGWDRSGLIYYVDAGTGVEYVGTRHGGLMIREGAGEDDLRTK